ncbi:glycosyltransferase family 4 protein [Echinicola sp. CAU 1574]|uniref:Glycosyltransferase family 4 protein n=1 Tax=Echinicola arenosa TaxID=2774144 RepID=A0ABR9AR77_9BACT|nr:glycosyltransferase family 4 protein [Echinicola arenosa]MBD8490445.1 glycosyltransferase family 4 protein [Echinicola arenosa]
MKVLYLIDTLQTGGAEKSLLSITRGFKEVTPVFWVIFKGNHRLLNEFLEAGIIVKTWGFSTSSSCRMIAEKLNEQIAELKPDIVHASLFRSEMISRKLQGEFLLVNSLVNNSYHWRRYRKLSVKSFLSLLLVHFRDYFTSRRVDYWFSNSGYLGEVHQKTLGIPNDKITTIPRGRSSEEFILRKQKHQDSAIFITVGRLIPRKGHSELLRAFRSISTKYPTSQLWIVGEGPDLNKLTALAKKLQISDSVTFWGNSNQVSKLLSEANFFVFPSHYEGFPGALIEAMFSKIPIIASAIPENKSCVPSDLGLWFEVFNWKDMAYKMEEAIESDRWESMTNEAHRHALELLDVRAISTQYEKAYQLLLEKRALKK